MKHALNSFLSVLKSKNWCFCEILILKKINYISEGLIPGNLVCVVVAYFSVKEFIVARTIAVLIVSAYSKALLKWTVQAIHWHRRQDESIINCILRIYICFPNKLTFIIRSFPIIKNLSKEIFQYVLIIVLLFQIPYFFWCSRSLA